MRSIAKLSFEERNHMQAAVQRKVPAGVEMSVNVLTSGYWPSYPIVEATLPQELALYSQVFMDHYLQKHSGRRLHWHNSLGTCVLRAQFAKGPKELQVSLFQVGVCGLQAYSSIIACQSPRKVNALQGSDSSW